MKMRTKISKTATAKLSRPPAAARLPKTFFKAATVTAILPLSLFLSGCAANENNSSTQSGDSGSGSSTVSGSFEGAGASSQEAAQAAWISGFQTQNPQVTINYNPVGSGAGRERFIQGATSFAGSDSYLSDEELEGTFDACADSSSAIDLPVYISPIAIAFNVDGVDRLNLDAETLARIFNGEITNWSDSAIVELNPEADLPDQNITVVYRSDDSGTTENFTEYLYDNVPEVWDNEPSETYPYNFAGAEGAQGTSGVVDAIANGTGTIGYADASRIGDLATVNIKVGDEFVSLSAEAAAAVVDASPQLEGRSENDLAIDIDRTTTESGAYPLVLVSYLIVCEQYEDSSETQFVKEYVSYVVSAEGQQAAAEGAGSAPISDATRESILAVIERIS